MTKENAKTMLFVIGIIEVIFGAIATLAGVVALVGGAALGGSGDALGAGVGILAAVVGLVSIISGVLTIIVGILGIKCKKDESKAKLCFIIGIVLLAIEVVNIIMAISNGSFGFGSVFGLVLPGLYTYAAYVLKGDAA